MLNEGFYFNTLIAAAICHSHHRVSNDATDSYGNEKGVNRKSQHETGKPYRSSEGPKMDKVKESEQLIKQLLDTITKKELEINDLKSQIEKSKERSDIVAKRSYEITEKMAKVTESKGNFDNMNDGFAKLHIANEFSNVYDREWVHLSRWLAKQFPEKSELELIQSLTSVMKECYKECVCLAEEQVRHFMFFDESQNAPLTENHQELFAIRKRYAQTDTTRSKIKQIVLSKVCNEDRIKCFLKGDKDEDTRHLIHDFLNKYVDCCWLMVVSNPPLALNFEVVGKEYCKEHFKIYCAKQRHVDGTNLVREVVWPCVYYADRSSFCKRGYAFVKYAKSSSDCGNSDDCGTTVCTCFTTDENTADSISSNADQIKDSATSDNKRSSGSATDKVTDIY